MNKNPPLNNGIFMNHTLYKKFDHIPIFDSITYEPNSYEDWVDILRNGIESPFPLYATEGNVTVKNAEEILAELCGAESCLLTTSGRSAISQSLFSTLQAGDQICIPAEAYRSTRFFCENTLSRFNIDVQIYDLCDIESLYSVLDIDKRITVLIEAPSNPMTRVPDFDLFFELKENLNIQLFIDVSLAGFSNIIRSDFDLYFHSVSKFGTGVGDIMAGAVLGSKKMIDRIRKSTRSSCDILDPRTAHILIKGLKTYDLRFNTQQDNALEFAHYLEGSKYFSNILYPWLSSHPDHKYATRQLRGGGQIVSAEINIDQSQLPHFLNNLRVFTMSYGAGFTHSLIAPTKLFYERGFSKLPKESSTIRENTLRFSIGTEDTSLIIEDIEQSLSQIKC